MNASRRDRLRDPGHARLFRNAVLVAGGQGSVLLLFVTYILAARVLGAAGYGDFTLGMTIALLLMALPAWGTARYTSILAARDPGRTLEIVSGGAGLILVLGAAYLPLVWLTASLVSPSAVVVQVALLLGVDFITREVSILLRMLLRVHDAFATEMTTVYAERVLMFVIAVATLVAAPGPVPLAMALMAGRSAGTAVTIVLFARRVGRFWPRFQLRALRDLWRGGTPIAIRRAIGSLSFKLDTVFLGAMRSSVEVGLYGTVYTLMDGVLMLPTVVTGSMGPTLSANFAQDRHEVVGRLYRRGLKYLVLAGLFLAAVFAVLSEAVVDLLYGAEYARSAAALRILSISVVFVFVRRQATEVLDNVDLRSTTAWIFAAGLLVNVVLNFVLIPPFGYLGAAAATVVTEGYLMAAMLWALHKASYTSEWLRSFGAPALAMAVGVVPMWLLRDSPAAAVAACAVTYLVGLTALGVWDDKDRLVLEGVAAKFRGGSKAGQP